MSEIHFDGKPHRTLPRQQLAVCCQWSNHMQTIYTMYTCTKDLLLVVFVFCQKSGPVKTRPTGASGTSPGKGALCFGVYWWKLLMLKSMNCMHCLSTGSLPNALQRHAHHPRTNHLHLRLCYNQAFHEGKNAITCKCGLNKRCLRVGLKGICMLIS